MNIRFFLKEPKLAKETMLYITATIGGKRMKRSIGVRVKPSNWTGTKVKTLARDSVAQNLKIENASKILKEIEREYLLQGIPLSKEIVEKEFDQRINPEKEKVQKSFIEVFNDFILSCKPTKSENTIKTYNTCKRHLSKFSREKKISLNFENIDMSFYDDLLAYFLSNNFLNTTISKYIKVLKTFMKWSNERGYHSNMICNRFRTFKEDSEKIKISADIVEKLRMTDFEDEYKNIVKDLFILSCYTGLRFSDIQSMKEDNVSSDFLKIHIKKTREVLEIPLLDVPKQIIERHLEKYGRLKVPTNQFCNREIKKMFEKIQFDDNVSFTKHSGKKNIVIERKACDFVTMHYGRTFFVTNSLVNGMNEETIRKITGHKDYKSFKKYVQFSKEMVAESLLTAWGN